MVRFSGLFNGGRKKYDELSEYIINLALKAVEELTKEGWDSLLLAKEASRYAIAGKFDEALEIAERIKNDTARSRTLAGIAIELAKAGYEDKAKEVLDKAIEVAETIENANERSRALATIALRLTRARKFNKAIEVAERIENAGWRLWALKNIASELIEAGYIDKAKEVLDRAIEVAVSIENNQLRLDALRYIISEFDKAVVIPILRDKAKEYERKGEPEKVIEIYEHIGDRGLKS